MERFVRDGHDVTVLDALSVGGSLAHLSEVQDQIRFVWHDLRSPVPDIGQFDWIAHLAAESHVDRSIQDPVGFVMANVVGTAHMLNFAREQRNLQRFFQMSTDEILGSAEGLPPFGENGRAWPTNPYAASKEGAEALCTAYQNTYDIPIVLSHCTNAFGTRQDKEKLIPLVRNKILAGEKVLIHARNGVSSTRFYVHTSDICSAIVVMLEGGELMHGPDTGKYNISGDQERTNLSVAQDIAAILGKPLDYEMVDFVEGRPRHDMRYSVDDSKLRALGWKPEVDWSDGLRHTLEWYSHQEQDMRQKVG